MDDAMIDLMADAGLRQRLEAYAGARLSPDPAATTRMRARVLAVAHRESAVSRADTSLALVSPGPLTVPARPRDRHERNATWRRVVSIGLAAAVAVSLAAGTALAARPGGALYDVRVWAETITLPSDASQRAVAEVGRLDDRLTEAAAAAAAGDLAGAQAALDAYQEILGAATTAALLADDPVASAALEAGVARNVIVLTDLLERLSDPAASAIGRAIDRALERSDSALDAIHPGRPGGDDNGGAGGNPPSGTDGSNGNGTPDSGQDGNGSQPTPKPDPTAKPEPTAKPTKPPTPEPVEKPDTDDPGKKPSDKPQPTPRSSPRGGQGGGQGG
jgi:hypothetical protein